MEMLHMDGFYVFMEPENFSVVIISLDPKDTVKVESETDDNWFMIELSVGTFRVDQMGWKKGVYVNFNGPCYDLPAVVP